MRERSVLTAEFHGVDRLRKPTAAPQKFEMKPLFAFLREKRRDSGR